MKDQEMTEDLKKKKGWVVKLFLFFAFFLGLVTLVSCTKAFTSSSDKANIIYSYLYGQDSASEEDKTAYLDDILSAANTAGYPVPSTTYTDKYLSVEFDYDNVLSDSADEDGAYTVEAFPTPVEVTYGDSTTAVLSKPQEWIENYVIGTEELTEDEKETIFGKSVMTTINVGSKITPTSSETALQLYQDSFQSIKAVALFGGLDSEKEITLWANYDEWFVEAQTDSNIGYANMPTSAFVSYFKSEANTIASNNLAGLNTSGEGGMYGHAGSKIYIENKTWGEAFTQYGFLEGLLVWPIGWMVNYFDSSFVSLGTGWSEFFAILVVTLIVRSVIVLTSIATNSSQNKMTAIQPEIDALKAKYPNAETNKEEKAEMSKETMVIYKKHKIHPLMPLLLLVVQLPLFICVWSALQGSAELSSGNFFGIDLTTSMSNAMLGSSTNSTIYTQVLAITMFVVMSVAQVLSMLLPQTFQSWKSKKFVNATAKVQPSSQNFAKYMSLGMGVVVIIMGISLPAAMSMYWFFGAIMSIIQTLVTEYFAKRKRHKNMKGGDTLSALRRSKHHSEPLKSIRSSRG